jgi:hypothetical protein
MKGREFPSKLDMGGGEYLCLCPKLSAEKGGFVGNGVIGLKV